MRRFSRVAAVASWTPDLSVSAGTDASVRALAKIAGSRLIRKPVAEHLAPRTSAGSAGGEVGARDIGAVAWVRIRDARIERPLWPRLSVDGTCLRVGTLEVVQSGTRPTLDESFARGLHECCVRHAVTELARPVGADEHALARIVVVRDASGALLGGGRVHERHASKGFPAESALRHFPEVCARIRELSASDTVELTAVWATPAGKQSGVPRLIAQAGIACGIVMDKRSMFMISHAQFGPVLHPIGMIAIPGTPEVPFPTAGYRSRLYAADLSELAKTAKPNDVVATIAGSLGEGTDVLALQELTSIEHGRPVWMPRRRTTQRQRSVA